MKGISLGNELTFFILDYRHEEKILVETVSPTNKNHPRGIPLFPIIHLSSCDKKIFPLSS